MSFQRVSSLNLFQAAGVFSESSLQLLLFTLGGASKYGQFHWLPQASLFHLASY